MTKTTDNKQKEQLMEKMLKDYPQVRIDGLKRYYLEKSVEFYLDEPAKFNKETSKWEKKEKKGELPEPKKLPEEIVCLDRIDGDARPKPEMVVGADGYIKDLWVCIHGFFCFLLTCFKLENKSFECVLLYGCFVL